jgi:nucleoid DNA-binding protein
LRHLKKGITKEALVKKIVSEYDTTEREAERDLNSFLRSLKKNGLVEF